MSFRLNELRCIIRTIILEGEEDVYDDTALPGEEADEDLLGEPDLTDQEERDDYITSRQAVKSKKKKARLRARDETSEAIGDEAMTVGGGGIAGHMGGAWGPPKKSKPLKSKNAMGGKKSKRSLDEYDE